MRQIGVLSLLAVLTLGAPLSVLGQQLTAANAKGTPDEDLSNLLAILNQETEIATKTKMNSDFVPGIVTVLQGDELEALGVRTVWEALSLVPGVEPARDVAASPSVVVRGIDFPFNSGNIKIMVDGVPLTREAAGVNGGVLLIPIEQVERIEFIRGPGSVMYGEFAFMGLVNIVMRHDGNRIFLAGDSNRTAMIGALGSWKGDGGLELSANAAGWRSSDAEIADPRTAEERRQYGSVTLSKGGLKLSAQELHRTIDDTTDPPLAAVIHSYDRTWATDVEWSHSLRDKLDLTTRAAVLGTDVRSGGTHYDDRVYRGSLDLQWGGLGRQSWLGSLEYSSSRIGTASQLVLAPPGVTPPPPFLVKDKHRDVVAVTLQDQVDVSDRLSVTAGLRYSDYSDVRSRVTPRLSLVWRPSEHHILKAQYAEGFRSPTFFELYGGGSRNPNIDFEINRTTEINYVYRRPKLTSRVTLFHSELQDMIFGVPRSGLFDNSRSARAEGVELEWTQQITPWLKVLANASRVHTRDNRGPMLDFHQSYAEPDWMGDLALLLHPTDRLLLSSRLYHVGSRDAASLDPYDLVDFTLTVRRLFRNLDLRVGVKNILDDPQGYPFTSPQGSVIQNYRGRTTTWAQLSWSR